MGWTPREMLEHLAPYAARGYLCEVVEVPATGPLTSDQAFIKNAGSDARAPAEVRASMWPWMLCVGGVGGFGSMPTCVCIDAHICVLGCCAWVACGGSYSGGGG